MRYKALTLVSLLFLNLTAMSQTQTDEIKTNKGPLKITPVIHASMLLSWEGKSIYIDPAQNTALFKDLPMADMILITDIHADHMDPVVLDAIGASKAIIVAPQAVADKLPTALKGKIVVLKNGGKTEQLGIAISAIPMYNLPEAKDAMHTKGRGNGYILNVGGKNLYISGDTEDIPEMRALKNIDVAFVCMNLPYTMDITQAASAVLEFKPAVVYPYHHKGQDIRAFKKLVNDSNKEIDVRVKNWYPKYPPPQ
jgi:L-ascorbate metabolism protein UlaG (beta-lactamase superfamily)